MKNTAERNIKHLSDLKVAEATYSKFVEILVEMLYENGYDFEEFESLVLKT